MIKYPETTQAGSDSRATNISSMVTDSISSSKDSRNNSRNNDTATTQHEEAETQKQHMNIEALEATEGGTDLSNDYTKAFEDSPSEEGITEGAIKTCLIRENTLQGLRTAGPRILIQRD